MYIINTYDIIFGFLKKKINVIMIRTFIFLLNIFLLLSSHISIFQLSLILKLIVTNYCFTYFVSVTQELVSESEYVEERLYKCSYCDKRFTQKRYKTRHEWNICPVNPENIRQIRSTSHTCKSCGASFSRIANLAAHCKEDCGNVHQCPGCGKTYLEIGNLRRHLRNGSCKVLN